MIDIDFSLVSSSMNRMLVDRVCSSIMFCMKKPALDRFSCCELLQDIARSMKTLALALVLQTPGHGR